MPSTDRKLELQAKDIDVSTVSQPAVCSNGLMVTFVVTVIFVNNLSNARMVGMYGFAKAPENFRRTEIFYLYYNYTCSTFY